MGLRKITLYEPPLTSPFISVRYILYSNSKKSKVEWGGRKSIEKGLISPEALIDKWPYCSWPQRSSPLIKLGAI
jgi:hypothetical protein